MSENGQVDVEIAEQAVQETAGVPEKLWLHPDALRPRDYIRGKEALKDVLATEGLDNCYDFLGTEWMYPWLMWALESRTDPSFTWEQALDRDFWHYRMGGDERPSPVIPPLSSSGRSDSTPAGNATKPKRPRPAPAPNSSSGSG